MRHISRLLISSALLLFVSSGIAYSQTLADAARQAQATKKTQTTTGHVYTNDSLEFHEAAAPPPAKTDVTSPDGAAPDAAANPDAPKDADADAKAADAKKKAADEIKEKVTKQEGDIELLKRELDVLQREDKMRAAVFYADAGSRLRDPGKYTADEQKYQNDIAAKQKALTDAQANLDKLKEEARRAGVPVS